jgi:hypothetical protein
MGVSPAAITDGADVNKSDVGHAVNDGRDGYLDVAGKAGDG